MNKPFLKTLSQDFPQLKIDEFKQLGTGEDNIALLINGEFIFRIPKRPPQNPERKNRRVKAEVELLRAVHGKLPVATPEPAYVPPTYDYFGYRLLPGNPLVEQPSSYWTPQHLDQFIAAFVEVATIVPKLLPDDKARALGLEDFHDVPNRLKNTEGALQSGTLPDEIAHIAEYSLKQFPKKWQAAIDRGVIPMHGDLGLTNWLVSEEGVLTALIDWSDACIAPPEHQLSYWVWESPEHIERFIEAYTAATGQQPDIELMYLDKFIGALSEIGEAVAGSGEKADISWQLDSIRRWRVGFEYFRER